MSVLIDALRPHVIPALYRVLGPRVDGLATAIESRPYTPLAAPAGRVSLSFQDPFEIAAHYAADVGRFASASFETMLVVDRAIGNELGAGWCVVQLYYAAFYAAHAILRMFGCSCSFLSAATTSRLTRILGVIGLNPTPALTGGLYGCSLAGPDVTLIALGSGASGGSHELFWRRFVQELDALAPLVLAGPLPTLDAQDAAARLLDLRNTLVAGAAQPDWLTRLRNEVQYRHVQRLWYPSRLGVRERRQFVELVQRWDADDPRHVYPRAAGSGDLPEFASACTFLTAVCRGLVLDIAARTSRRSRSFVDYSAAKLLRENHH